MSMTALAQAYRLLMQGCGIAAALLFAAVAVLVAADVVMRNLGLGNLPWIVEISEYSLPVGTFLAAPWLLYRNEHVRVEILVNALPRPAAAALDRIADLIGLVACLGLAWYGIAVIRDSANIGSLIIKTLVFPEWWLFVPLPFGAVLLAIEFLRRLLRPLFGGAA